MIKLDELYCAVDKYIKLVDFNKLWSEFKPLKFALYNDKECFYDGKYITKTEKFLANTAINYNGEVIAIWNVLEDMNPIILASKMVHEMFHGFQMMNNESRFPNEMDALYHYKYSDENLSIKLLENRLINELIDNYDNDKFDELLSYRKYRYEKFNYDFMYETSIEQIEGSANYVELQVLKQLSSELYTNKLNDMKSFIINPYNLLPIRIVSYDIGALLLTILKDNNISFNDGFNDITIGVDIIKDYKSCPLNSCLCMSKYIDIYNNKTKEIIDRAIEKKDIIVNNNVDILGVNIYNARCYNSYIVSTYFIMYNDNNKQIIKYGDFVIESDEVAKASKIYKI